MSGYDYSQDVANEMLEECHAENTKLEAENAALRAELAAKQAKIDSLMLEFCPEEMTPEQMEEWARNQRPYAGDVVMVPREPTKEMIEAGNEGFRSPDARRHAVSSCYKAMLSAAPGVQAGEKDNAGGNSAAEGSPA